MKLITKALFSLSILLVTLLLGGTSALAGVNVTASASPNPVPYGGSTQVTWSSSGTDGTGVVGCTIGGLTYQQSGSITVGPITEYTSKGVTCTGDEFDPLSWLQLYTGYAPVDIYPQASCGDGIVNGTEQCDLGTNYNGACPSSCNFGCTSNACTTATKICPSTATLAAGATTQLRGYYSNNGPIDCNNPPASSVTNDGWWSTFNSNFSGASSNFSINNTSPTKGLVTGTSKGTGYASFTYGGLTDYANITVTAPDLTASAVSPTTATAGVATTFSATVTNIGNATTGAQFKNFFQRADAYNSATDVATNPQDIPPVPSFILAGPLGANEFASITSSSYTFPAADAGTTRYVRACADKSGALNGGLITESNEGNNCGTWTAITVASAPKLTLCPSNSTIYGGYHRTAQCVLQQARCSSGRLQCKVSC